MAFITEPETYKKTALSDLEYSWGLLRKYIIDNFAFQASDQLIFHIDEAMSWESVRDIKQMKSILLLIHNIAMENNAPKVVIGLIEIVREDLELVPEDITVTK